jgi:hypothetical protein
MYQATPVAELFGSLAYLISLVASICFANMPRAKFLQNLVRHIFFVCFAAAMAILGLWCVHEAKVHTQPPGSTDQYNSSAAAVSAVFLFFNVYLMNAFRAVRANGV